MIDKINDEFIVDCTNNSKEERQQVYKFLVDNRNYSKIYLNSDASIIVCNKKQGNTNWNSRQYYYSWFNSKKDLPIYTFEQFKEMYLEEQFVLPEKWYIKSNGKETYTKYLVPYLKQIGYPYINWDGKDYYYHVFKNNCSAYTTKLHDYKEITFEQFKKYVLKQETMEKEIIGYKLVKHEYSDAARKIVDLDLPLTVDRITPKTKTHNSTIMYDRLKKAGVLELWFEPVYKEEKTIVKMYSSNKGEFEIEVVGKKAYYRPDNKELTKEFIEEILDWFDNSINHSYDSRTKLLYSLTVQSLKVGCMEGTRQTDWLKVYDLIK